MPNKQKYKFKICSEEKLAELTVIHFGNTVYKPKKFLPIKNENWVKPKGGLWTSPVNSKEGWKNWCHSEEFRVCKESNSFKLKFFNNTKILIIETLDDLKNLLRTHSNFSGFKSYIDYEKLVNDGIDAIWLTAEGQWDTRLSHPVDLYGWDCETVFIMNKKCCFEEIIRRVLIEKFKPEEVVIFDND